MSPQQIIEALRDQLSQRDATIDELAQAVAKLTGELDWCKRQLFGRKSERFEDPNQPKLFDDAPPERPEPQFQTVAGHRRTSGRRGKREPIPEDLRRQRIVHDLPEDQQIDPVTGQVRLQKIGEAISEKLAFRPGEVYVERHVRIKYRRVDHQNLSGSDPEIVTAPASGEGLAKCLAAPSLLAEIAVRKFGDHQPLHRLVKIFKRHGVTLSKSSMCRWMQDAGELIHPLLDLMKRRMLAHSRVIQHDDTPVKQMEPGSGQTRTCRFWPALGEPGTSGHYVLFDYTQNRERAGPEAWFRGASDEPLFAGGLLQCDAYSGYNGLLDPQGKWKMIHVGCWAHVRRKFHDARTGAPAQACHAMGLIRQLYEVERKFKDATDEQRVEHRRKSSSAVVDAFFEFCGQKVGDALPKSKIGKAFNYALNLEEPLRRYLEVGHLQIDNNACERSLRGIAVGRKNWLFAGSPAGGRAAARLMSLIGSANLHGVEPMAYVHDVIRRLPATPISRIEQFLPDLWKA